MPMHGEGERAVVVLPFFGFTKDILSIDRGEGDRAFGCRAYKCRSEILVYNIILEIINTFFILYIYSYMLESLRAKFYNRKSQRNHKQKYNLGTHHRPKILSPPRPPPSIIASLSLAKRFPPVIKQSARTSRRKRALIVQFKIYRSRCTLFSAFKSCCSSAASVINNAFDRRNFGKRAARLLIYTRVYTFVVHFDLLWNTRHPLRRARRFNRRMHAGIPFCSTIDERREEEEMKSAEESYDSCVCVYII